MTEVAKRNKTRHTSLVDLPYDIIKKIIVDLDNYDRISLSCTCFYMNLLVFPSIKTINRNDKYFVTLYHIVKDGDIIIRNYYFSYFIFWNRFKYFDYLIKRINKDLLHSASEGYRAHKIEKYKELIDYKINKNIINLFKAFDNGTSAFPDTDIFFEILEEFDLILINWSVDDINDKDQKTMYKLIGLYEKKDLLITADKFRTHIMTTDERCCEFFNLIFSIEKKEYDCFGEYSDKLSRKRGWNKPESDKCVRIIQNFESFKTEYKWIDDVLKQEFKKIEFSTNSYSKGTYSRDFSICVIPK